MVNIIAFINMFLALMMAPADAKEVRMSLPNEGNAKKTSWVSFVNQGENAWQTTDNGEKISVSIKGSVITLKVKDEKIQYDMKEYLAISASTNFRKITLIQGKNNSGNYTLKQSGKKGKVQFKSKEKGASYSFWVEWKK
jgi:hypothetical protein